VGFALLTVGVMDVAPDGGAVFEEMLRLFPMQWAGGLKRFFEVLRKISKS